MYSKSKNTVYVNLYASNEALVEIENNSIDFSQKTDYPWNGKVSITVNPKKNAEFTIKLRVPGWARNQVLPGDLYSYATKSASKNSVTVNGESFENIGDDGFIAITRNWKKNDKIELDFPMDVKEVLTNEIVMENKGKIALEYGPIVYAVEEIDNKNGYDKIVIFDTDVFEVKKEANLLGGVNTIQNEKLKAVPYYAWSNRGVGKMKVWIQEKSKN
jgi:DUF1680 family protein